MTPPKPSKPPPLAPAEQAAMRRDLQVAMAHQTLRAVAWLRARLPRLEPLAAGLERGARATLAEVAAEEAAATTPRSAATPDDARPN